MALRPQAGRRRRRVGRHRHACLQSCPLRLGTGAGYALGRPGRLRAGPPARRQRPCAVALQAGRQQASGQGHDLGEPGGARPRERAEAAHLRLEGWAGMGAGRSELLVVYAVRPAEAVAHPRRRRRHAGGGACHARAIRPSGGLSRRLRQHLPGGGPRHPRCAQEGRQACEGCRLPDDRGRRRRHGLHRSLREVVEEEWGVDQTLGGRPGVLLTRIASRIAKGNSGQSDLSPRGEETSNAGADLFPLGEKVAAKRPDEGEWLSRGQSGRPPRGGGRR
ncbi:hypothetical protein MPLB_390002 [Mesorhizobium sp. ORS 3324]|nr:hypothetical protein MPLB_390002 [Mesorhizobium sp. ORS 3324]